MLSTISGALWIISLGNSLKLAAEEPNTHTYFPICCDPNGSQKYASAIGQGEIQKMCPGAEAIMRQVQPCSTGDNTLWYIHELDRNDKHRLIFTVATILKGWKIVIQPGWEIAFDETGEPLEEGYEIVRVPALTYHRQAHEAFKLGIDIAFGQSEVVAGKPVLETLNHMADFVDSIVASFEPFLTWGFAQRFQHMPPRSPEILC